MSEKPLIGESQLWRIADKVPEGGVILEWGSGFSTKFWLDNTKAAEIYTVENNPFWRRRVQEVCENDPRLSIIYCENLEAEHCGMEALHGFDEYASLPEVPVDRADTILVDGFARAACVATAAMRAKIGAYIYLHDSDSKNYKWCIQHLNSHPSWSPIGRWPPLPEDSICAELQAWQRID